jgi:ubiquinone/menaquinone biosynthesis C-methylase UbiE
VKGKQKLLKKVVQKSSPRARSILEIGAGSGLIRFFLVTKLNYQDYLVSDYSVLMLKKAKERLLTQEFSKN